MITSAEVIQSETWCARQYRDEDKPSLLRLSALHYGDKDLTKEEYVDWLYSGSPAGRAHVIVAEDLRLREIIGFAWHVPVPVSFQGRPVVCHMGCNGVMHPGYRRLGVYTAIEKLVPTTIGESLFLYGFPKQAAIGSLRKAGWFNVSPLPILVRPLDIARLTRARIATPVMRMGVNLGWWIGRTTIWRPHLHLAQSTTIRVTEEDTFDESFDHFWQRVAHKYDIIVPRDSAFLRWRFRNLPFRTYSILSARSDGNLVGYTVLRCVHMEGVPTGLIIDLLVEPTARGEESGLRLIEEATRRFGKAGMALGGCLMLPHTQEYALLRQTGYLECPERFAPQPFCLVATSLSPPAPKEVLAQASRWFITMANHDAV